MADYFTEFSFLVKDVTQEEAEWLSETFTSGIYKGEDEESSYKDCFGMEVQENPEMQAWFHDDGGQPTLDALVKFLQEFLKKFRRDAEVFFEWGYSCSKPHTDAYGGGAALITATRSATKNTQDFMELLQEEIKKAV